MASGRIILTKDRDFGELIVRGRLQVAGIVLLELDRLINAAEADAVTAFIAAGLEKISGHLVVIEPSRVRIRPLLK